MARDANLYFRAAAAGALNANGESAAIDLGNTRQIPLRGMVVRLDVGAATGTSPTLAVKVQDSDNGSAYRDLLTFPGMTAAGKAVARVYTERRYLRLNFVVGGTTPNFASVVGVLTNADSFGN